MRLKLSYHFNYIENCNMCGESTKNQKILGKRLNTSQGKNPKNKTGITTTVCKCNNCGLIYANPQPIPFDLQDHYGVMPDEYWKESYFVIEDNYLNHEIDTIKKLLAFKPGFKSLDIGAGIGKAMKKLEQTGFDAYGIEPSEQFHHYAVSKMKISADKLKLCSIENAEFPDDFFDFISFGVVLEHLYDPSEAISKALKWTKPNGIIHIEVPSSDWLINKCINLYYKLRGLDYVGNISPMHEPYHLYEFSLKSFEENAKKSNYQIAHYQYYVSETYMPKILDFFLKPYMRKTNKGMMFSVWLKKNN